VWGLCRDESILYIRGVSPHFFQQVNMSKGSRPRPIKDRKKFDDNWDRIFGKKKEKDSK